MGQGERRERGSGTDVDRGRSSDGRRVKDGIFLFLNCERGVVLR